MTCALMDNDVVHRTVVFELLDHIAKTPKLSNTTYGVLPTARFVLRRVFERRPPACGKDVALQRLQDALKVLTPMEPTADEVRVAGEFEFAALQQGMEFNSGESMLCAMLLARNLNHLATGDKRAISAIQVLMEQKKISPEISGKVLCLEQLVLLIGEVVDTTEIRKKICAEKEQDRAIAICFSCSSPEIPADANASCLHSYISDIRRQAPTVLLPEP